MTSGQKSIDSNTPGERVPRIAGQAIRHTSYPLGGVFFALSFLVPSGQVWAENECGTYNTSLATISCDASSGGTFPNYSTGITYNPSAAFTLELNDASIEVDAGVVVSGSNDVSIIAGDFNRLVTVADSNAGLAALTVGDYDAQVQMDSGIITTGGVFAYGLHSSTSNGASRVLLTGGTIVATGFSASGIYASSDGFGESLAQMDGGSITTSSRGLFSSVLSLAGDSTGKAIALMTAGTIVTSGLGQGHGLLAQNSDLGDALTQMDGGSIITDGESSHGLYSSIVNSVDNAGVSVARLTAGNITTRGINSIGLLAITGGVGDAKVRMDGGSITTMGVESMGLASVAYSFPHQTLNSTVLMTGGSIVTSGEGGDGVLVYSNGTGDAIAAVSGTSTVVVNGVDANGIYIELSGEAVNTYTISVSDTAVVTGGSGDGAAIYTLSKGSGSITIAAGATIDGSAGIAAIFDAAGNTTVNVAGTVLGDTILGLGDDSFNLTGGSNTGDIYGDGVLASIEDGSDSFNWSGGALNSGFYGGNGSDTAMISGAAIYDGTEVLDGGDDVATADGWTDTLTFQNISATAAAGTVINWETIIIDGGTMTFADQMLTVGGDADTGLSLINGGTLNTSGGFTLTGNLNNSGLISSQNGSTGDIITINGDYVSDSGQIQIDAVLGGDASATDKFVINGDSSGSTSITVQDVGGSGAPTVNGIEIISVSGSSAGNFVLNGDFVTALGEQAVVSGAYGYTLAQQTDGDWALISGSISDPDPEEPTPEEPTPEEPIPEEPIPEEPIPEEPTPEEPVIVPLYQPGAPIYEAFAQNLLALNTLPTLQQRVIGRRWNSVETKLAGSGGWSRIVGGSRDLDSKFTATGTSTDTRYEQVQVGFDMPVETNANYQIIAGINASYGQATTDVSSAVGEGNIESDSYSIGMTGTWRHDNNLYADGQLQYSITNSELNSDILGGLVDDIDGKGLSASIEVGKRMALQPDDSLSFIPQLQLSYNRVDFDDFSGSNAERVSLEDGKSLKLRLGLSLDHRLAQSDGAANVSSHLYSTFNFIYEFENETQVGVSGVNLSNETDKTYGELIVGGAFNWGDDKYSLYGELSVGSSLNNFGASQSSAGTLGFRMKL